MKIKLLIAALVVIVIVVAVALIDPLWFILIWYLPLMWFGCPDYNALGGCGQADAKFIISRSLVGLTIVAVVCRLIYKRFKKRRQLKQLSIVKK